MTWCSSVFRIYWTIPAILDDIDVIINVGDGDTAHTGGEWWSVPAILEAVRGFVYKGGGFIGVGEPSGHQYQGHYFQLASVLGVEKETGFTLGYDKYNWEEHPHFILEDAGEVDFGEGKKNIFALEGARVLIQREKEVQMAVNEFGKAVGSTSADFHTVLRTVGSCIARCYGVPIVKTSFTPGSAAITVWMSTYI